MKLSSLSDENSIYQDKSPKPNHHQAYDNNQQQEDDRETETAEKIKKLEQELTSH
jgi:hypothetical protein